MEIKDMKKVNKKEAWKLFQEQKKTEEINRGIEKLRYAQNEIDRLDREIAMKERLKATHLETIKQFKDLK